MIQDDDRRRCVSVAPGVHERRYGPDLFSRHRAADCPGDDHRMDDPLWAEAFAVGASVAMEERHDMRTLFDLQYARMTEATARWRAEDPATRAQVQPDLGTLLTWLMAAADAGPATGVVPVPSPVMPPLQPGPHKFSVVLVFDVGDPETVAKMTFQDVFAHSHDAAALSAVERMATAHGGFTEDDLIQVTVTRANPAVKPNLLAQHRH